MPRRLESGFADALSWATCPSRERNNSMRQIRFMAESPWRANLDPSPNEKWHVLFLGSDPTNGRLSLTHRSVFYQGRVTRRLKKGCFLGLQQVPKAKTLTLIHPPACGVLGDNPHPRKGKVLYCDQKSVVQTLGPTKHLPKNELPGDSNAEEFLDVLVLKAF